MPILQINKYIDDFGKFGFEKFLMNREIVLYTSTFITLFCSLGFLSASAAYTTDYSSLQHVSFGKSDYNGLTYYYGLQSQTVELSGVVTVLYYNSAACKNVACHDCYNASNAAFGLALISLFLSLLLIIVCILRIYYEDVRLKLISVFIPILVIIFGFAGFGDWNNICYNSIYTNLDKNIVLYQGFNIYVCATVITFVVLFLNIATPSFDPIAGVIELGERAHTVNDFSRGS